METFKRSNDDMLRKMFRTQIGKATCVAVREWSSWNDGGHYVEQIWRSPDGNLFRTVYNDLRVDHPDTLIQPVAVKTREVTDYEPIGTEYRYGKVGL